MQKICDMQETHQLQNNRQLSLSYKYESKRYEIMLVLLEKSTDPTRLHRAPLQAEHQKGRFG